MGNLMVRKNCTSQLYPLVIGVANFVEINAQEGCSLIVCCKELHFDGVEHSLYKHKESEYFLYSPWSVHAFHLTVY